MRARAPSASATSATPAAAAAKNAYWWKSPRSRGIAESCCTLIPSLRLPAQPGQLRERPEHARDTLVGGRELEGEAVAAVRVVDRAGIGATRLHRQPAHA